ncbi:hypothetical protein HMPREF0620_1533 [Parascardovia denticolens DSM 10105 = JCM 12538]|uniref:Uncharacterized protein n=1 Tax=Parascardovia denticolens DSM 10105 = JCM 12538 TaxID=864564 RepID=E6K260_PARDN|nr:hypothetical protein [Parascardovia denticolens]EFG32184.1 hypothetical protein HMPREF9017_01080 [Parascardovia denticolens F0305]EFT82848.1 hypothetical protein HMPREF0620_1533 [Parascardovia denticolens DSM 10105 = JCM 12538]BAR04669.1 hypothetical protein PSDT_0150 [Parascardovia denticolens DSM 10105 = JCM 12538]
MLDGDLRAAQRRLVKDSFAGKMAALKRQEREFSALVGDLLALRDLHDRVRREAAAYRDEYLARSRARLVEELGVSGVEARYIFSDITTEPVAADATGGQDGQERDGGVGDPSGVGVGE